jgi:hypothetical protein
MHKKNFKSNQALLFVNKKKQKNFMTPGLGRWRNRAHTPE